MTKSRVEEGEPTGDSPIVSAEKLTKVYDAGEVQVSALNGIDLHVQKGEMVAVMGPSGCGKTILS